MWKSITAIEMLITSFRLRLKLSTFQQLMNISKIKLTQFNEYNPVKID
jgi:hypothetical protein